MVLCVLGAEGDPLFHQGVEGEAGALGRPPVSSVALTLSFLNSARIPALPGLNPQDLPVCAGHSVYSFSLSLGPPICSAISPTISYSIASPLCLLSNLITVPLPSAQ